MRALPPRLGPLLAHPAGPRSSRGSGTAHRVIAFAVIASTGERCPIFPPLPRERAGVRAGSGSRADARSFPPPPEWGTSRGEALVSRQPLIGGPYKLEGASE